MAEMGLGYGSEFQLMRFLGHHRDDLNTMIQNATGQYGDVKWRDFPYDDERLSGDGEWKGIECFKKLENYSEIEAKWKQYWPQKGTSMNWDGIFTIGDTWYFVEAKAHKDESYQQCSASSEKSKAVINTAFEKTILWLKAKPQIKWIDTNCYQLANRLAFLNFCKQCGIEARLLYIGFVKGFRRKKDEVQSAEDWINIWKEELSTLGLDIGNMSPFISFIHPDCEKDTKK